MRGPSNPTARVFLLALAVAFVASAVPTASHAAALIRRTAADRSFGYDTSGQVYAASRPHSVTGPARLQFEGVNGGNYYPNSGQSIDLGQFTVDSTVPGVATSFDGTPFRVQIHALGLDKTSRVPLLSSVFSKFAKDLHLKTVRENSVLLRGHLDGTVNADGTTDLKATVDSVRLGSLDPSTSDHITKYTFPIRFGELKLPPGWATAPSAYPHAVSAQVLATPAPEPSSILVFVAALGGLAFARYRRRPIVA